MEGAMNTMNRLFVCIVWVSACVVAFAVPIEDSFVSQDSFEGEIADSSSSIVAREEHGDAGVNSETQSRQIYLLSIHDFFAGDDSSTLAGPLRFFDTAEYSTASLDSQVVPEPPSGTLVLMGLAILVISQRMVPVNLRSVHSRLRVRRGHVPIR
jgi:hypothetical protein